MPRSKDSSIHNVLFLTNTVGPCQLQLFPFPSVPAMSNVNPLGQILGTSEVQWSFTTDSSLAVDPAFCPNSYVGGDHHRLRFLPPITCETIAEGDEWLLSLRCGQLVQSLDFPDFVPTKIVPLTSPIQLVRKFRPCPKMQ